MTNYRDAGDNLLADAVRYKKLWHEERAEAERLTALTAEQRLELIAGRIRGRLLRLEDVAYLDLQTVVQPDGRLNYRMLDLLLADLLRRRPELGAPNPEVGPIVYSVGDGADSVSDLL